MSFFDKVSIEDVLKELEDMSDEEFLRKAEEAGLIEKCSNDKEKKKCSD